MTLCGADFFLINDVNQLRILQDVVDRRLTTRLAAECLRIHDRQLQNSSLSAYLFVQSYPVSIVALSVHYCLLKKLKP